MRWTSVSVAVSWMTMDPGVTHGDGCATKILREDIKEGCYLPYKDPSGVLPSIKVIEVKRSYLKIEVGGRTLTLEPGGQLPLCRTGYNYTNFDLDIYMDAQPGPNPVEIDDPLAVARDRYKVFGIDTDDIERMKQEAETDNPDYKESWYLLGQWYWLTRPESGFVGKAEKLFRKAANAGCPDGWMGLAQLCRYKDPEAPDLEKYVKYREKALKNGSMAAELAYCLDLAEGVGGEADLDAAQRYAEEHIEDMQSTPAEWYDVLGQVLLKQGRKAEASSKFATAGIKGYISAYDGLLTITQSYDVIVRAEKVGCGRAYTALAESDMLLYEKAKKADKKEELKKRIFGNLEVAILMGDAAASEVMEEAKRKVQPQ